MTNTTTVIDGRYHVGIQNPRFELCAYVWDRQKKTTLVSFSYPNMSVDSQRKALAKCHAWLAKHLENV
jgi:hypothetical protein